ncbi:hypothetical protein ACFQYP_24700 [Nonomuraea antimicrobica]
MRSPAPDATPPPGSALDAAAPDAEGSDAAAPDAAASVTLPGQPPSGQPPGHPTPGRPASAGGAGPGVATARLSGVLVSPTDVELRWSETGSGAGTGTGAGERAVAGYALEFATAPEGPYTTLAFLPSGETAYTHPDLIPQTTFHYRLRPYYGPATKPVDVVLGGGPYGRRSPAGRSRVRSRAARPASSPRARRHPPT